MSLAHKDIMMESHLCVMINPKAAMLASLLSRSPASLSANVVLDSGQRPDTAAQ
jgi:hypothetical protein